MSLEDEIAQKMQTQLDALSDAGVDNPGPQVLRDALLATAEMTPNRRPSYKAVAYCAFRLGWKWDKFYADMKKMSILLNPSLERDRSKLSQEAGKWGRFRKSPKMWNQEGKGSGGRLVTIETISSDVERAIANLGKFPGPRKGKDWVALKEKVQLLARCVGC